MGSGLRHVLGHEVLEFVPQSLTSRQVPVRLIVSDSGVGC
jgi:hypothetical protein